jgi:FtsH-binding integral membrane protein
MANNTTPEKKNIKIVSASSSIKHHYMRTFFAGVFGFIGVNLILLSILVVWLSATLTNTNQYVKTVSPIVSDKVVQDYVVKQITISFLENKNIQIGGLAENVLTVEQRTGKTDKELKVIIEPMIKESLGQILASPTFAKLWTDTNRDAHTKLIAGINSPTGDVQLDFKPVIQGVTDELGKTRFGFIKDKMNIQSDAGLIKIESSRLDKARKIYDYFKKARLALLITALFAGIISVLLSVHHLKTLRRIALFTGIFTGLLAVALSATSLLKNLTGVGVEDKALAVKLIDILTHDLRLALIIISATTLVLAITSKIIAMVMVKKSRM